MREREDGMRVGMRRWGVLGCAVGALAAAGTATELRGQEAEGEPDAARAMVEAAMELMGGEERLRAVRTVRFDMMTQWQQTQFRGLPAADRPSYEVHYDVRDYTVPAWRNTRDFGARKIVNVIRDSVATTDSGDGPQPLSIAYVDERRELFAYTPDRLLIALADAPDLRAGPDTTLAGEPHHRVRATLADRFDAEVFFHARSAAPSLLRFTAGHENDYGLVPWGEMTVEVWYAGWRDFGGVAIPTQWDIHRVGVPYKRMSVRSAVFDPEFAADSFRVSEESRAAYLETATMPMDQSRPMQPYTLAEDGLLEGGGFGFPAGAVPTSQGWVAIGAGQAAYGWQVGSEGLIDGGAERIAAVLAANASTGNGGVVAAAAAGTPILTSPSAEPYVRRVLEAGRVQGDVRVVEEETAIGSGDERLLLVPISLPDAPRSLVAWHAASGWLYVPDARGPFGLRRAMALAAERGWMVRTVGVRQRFRMAPPAN